MGNSRLVCGNEITPRRVQFQQLLYSCLLVQVYHQFTLMFQLGLRTMQAGGQKERLMTIHLFKEFNS
jgi:hypothetical protein